MHGSWCLVWASDQVPSASYISWEICICSHPCSVSLCNTSETGYGLMIHYDDDQWRKKNWTAQQQSRLVWLQHTSPQFFVAITMRIVHGIAEMQLAYVCLMLICNAYMLRRNVIANLQYLWAMLQEIQECTLHIKWAKAVNTYTYTIPCAFLATLGIGELLLAVYVH